MYCWVPATCKIRHKTGNFSVFVSTDALISILSFSKLKKCICRHIFWSKRSIVSHQFIWIWIDTESCLRMHNQVLPLILNIFLLSSLLALHIDKHMIFPKLTLIYVTYFSSQVLSDITLMRNKLN